MIWESAPWKEELLRINRRMVSRKNQKRWPEQSLARVEQDFFTAFYAIRKLIEAHKLTDSLCSKAINLTCYPATGKPVTFMNSHRVDELYRFDKRHSQTLKLFQLCNQFIHSYVFVCAFSEEYGGLDGVLVSSDRERNRLLYYVSLDQVIKILQETGTCYSSSGGFWYDPDIQDFKVSNKMMSEEGGSPKPLQK